MTEDQIQRAQRVYAALRTAADQEPDRALALTTFILAAQDMAKDMGLSTLTFLEMCTKMAASKALGFAEAAPKEREAFIQTPLKDDKDFS